MGGVQDVLVAGGKSRGEGSLCAEELLQEAEQAGKLIERADLQAAAPARVMTVLQGCIGSGTVGLPHAVPCLLHWDGRTTSVLAEQFQCSKGCILEVEYLGDWTVIYKAVELRSFNFGDWNHFFHLCAVAELSLALLCNWNSYTVCNFNADM